MSELTLSMDAAPWRIINDGVMGGVSHSRIYEENGVLVFNGALSLENNGGFASARRDVSNLTHDLEKVCLQVRGDGRRYQFRIRQDSQFDGTAWKQSFDTTESWHTVELTLTDFEAVFRGRRVADAGPIVPEKVQQLGFMLADKTPGAFRLEVRSISFHGPSEAADASH